MSLDTEMAEQIVKLNEENKVLKLALKSALKMILPDLIDGTMTIKIGDNYYNRLEFEEYLIEQAKESINANKL